MKLLRYIVLDKDGHEVSRGKLNQKASRTLVQKGNTVEVLTDYVNRMDAQNKAEKAKADVPTGDALEDKGVVDALNKAIREPQV